MPERTCTVEGCERPHLAKDLCRSHYYKARREDPTRPRCERPDCDKAVEAIGLCKSHYYGLTSRAESTRRWRERNRDRLPELRRAARMANLEAVRLYHREFQRRRHAKMTERVDYAAILDRDGMVCHICTEPIASMADLHFDHVVPLSKGGPHIAENIRPSHALCNMRKSNRLIA